MTIKLDKAERQMLEAIINEGHRVDEIVRTPATFRVYFYYAPNFSGYGSRAMIYDIVGEWKEVSASIAKAEKELGI